MIWSQPISGLYTGGNILFSTYIGGQGPDANPIIQVENGEIYLLGQSLSTNYPVTNGIANSGSYDLVVTKFAQNGNVLFSTFIGGSDVELPTSLKVVSSEIFLFGHTRSTNYPVTDGSVFNGGGSSALFVTKLRSNGTICYSRYIGSSGNIAREMQIENGDIYLSGLTQANDYPVTTGASYRGGLDMVITKLTLCPSFSVVTDMVTPVSQNACINGLAQFITGSNIRIAGNNMPAIYSNGVASLQNEIYPMYQWQKAAAPGGPWINIPGAMQQNYLPGPSAVNQYFRRIASQSPCCGGAIISTSDVAAVLINSSMAPVVNAGGVFNSCPGSAISIGGTPAATGGLAPYTYSWDNGAGIAANPLVSPANNTIYTLTVTDGQGCQSVDQAVVNTYTADAGPDVSNCGGTAVRIGTAPVAGLSGVTYSWASTPASPTMSCVTCAQPTVNPSTATTYTLTTTIPKTGGGTCSTSDAVVVTPVAAPLNTNFAGANKTVCFGGTAVLGVAAQAGFTYSWAPGNYLVSNNIAQPVFQPGSLSLPNPNPITYYATATKSGCTFVDDVLVALIEARAGDDGCGARFVGEIDRIPAINETYSWTKVSGPGNFLGATNLPRVPVSVSVGGPTVYQLSVSYDGVTCSDLVTVTDGCQYPSITVSSPFGCPSFGINNGPVVLKASLPPALNPADFTFSWSPAAGLSGTTGQTVTLTDNVPRTYTITVTSIADPSYSFSQTVEVNNPAWSLPSFMAQHVTTCPGNPVSVGQTMVAGYSYVWEPASLGLNNYAISNPTAITNTTQNYPVRVTDILSGCFVKDTATVNILGTAANAGPDYTVCGNAVIQLGSPALPNTTYSWSPSTAPWQNSTNEFSAQPQVLVATNLTFTVTATNTITGCSSTDAVDVIINATPTINAPDKTICFGKADTIGVAALPGVSYSWSPAAGLSCSNCAQPLANPGSTTTYTVVATYPGGCTATDNVVVTVSNPSFSIPDISYCPSDPAFALAPTAPTGMTTYRWSPASQVSNATISNPNTLAPALRTPATFVLTVTNALGCTASDAVTIIPSISVPNGGSSRSMCLNTTTTLGEAGNMSSDIWSVISGPNTSLAQLSCSSCAQPVFNPAAVGNYLLMVSRTISGCTSTSTVNITVSGFTLPAIPSRTLCENACVQIGTNPLFGVQYFWSPAAGLSNPGIANPVACVGTSNKTYNLTAIGVNGCSATTIVSLSVNPGLVPQVTIPSVVACLGEIGLSFNPFITPAGSYNYQWAPSNGTLSSIYILNPQINLTGVGAKQYRLNVTDPISGCSNFADANLNVFSCYVLPVKIRNFTAEHKEHYVNLIWEVFEEENVANYTVEFSINGSNFKSIGSLSAAKLGSYGIRHNNPVYGWNYYRLKITDKDDNITYSDIRKINYSKGSSNGGGIEIYPNPAFYDIKIVPAPAMINKRGMIRIIAIDGRVVLQKSIARMGKTEIIDVSRLIRGNYLLHIISDNEILTKLFEVAK